MKVSGRRGLILVGVVAIVALAAGFAVAGKLENFAFLSYADHATGLRLGASDVMRTKDGYLLHDMTASTDDGAFFASAGRARVALGQSGVTIALERPHIVVSPLRYHAQADARLPLASGATHVMVRDGTLVVTGGTVPVPALTFQGVEGDMNVGSGEPPRYDIAMALVDQTNRYPVSGRAEGGTSVWTAAAVPLAPLIGLQPDDGKLQLQGGWLRDIEIDGGTATHAEARLDDASLALGDGSGVLDSPTPHELRGLHGKISSVGDGIGSRAIVGALDGVPFSFGGELHGLFGERAGGVRDLDALTALLARIANEPRLRSVTLEATAPGLAYAQYALGSDHGPLAISLLSLDPAEPTLRFDTAIAEDHVISGGERTSAMSVRTGAVAGVNGDYFDIGRTYQPQGMLVKDGALVRGPTDRAALAITDAKAVTFAEFRLGGVVRTKRGTMKITELNDWPSGDVSVITPDYGKELAARPGMTFVRLEPVGVGATHFRVTAVEAATRALPIGFGIGIGALVKTPPPKVGERIDVSYATTPSIARATTAIGGGPQLLRDGAAIEDPHAPAPDERDYRWPVIALARTGGDRLLFVAVDGRHPERSVGMTRPEFSELLRRLGATDAMALDSGGSVTLVSRAPGDTNVTVRNVPSDNSAERWVSDGLFLYSDAPTPTIVAPKTESTPVPEARPTP